MLRCSEVPARGFKGHSQARPKRPKIRLMIWRIGKGLTMPSKILVRKSQKTLGQKKPSRAAAHWYVAAVRMMRRAQWFLMSLPIVIRNRWSRSKAPGLDDANGSWWREEVNQRGRLCFGEPVSSSDVSGCHRQILEGSVLIVQTRVTAGVRYVCCPEP